MDNLAKLPTIKIAQDLKISLDDVQQYRTELLAESRGLIHLETNLLILREQELKEQLNPIDTNGHSTDSFRDTDVAGKLD